ncbi:MAG: hypothetical protein LUF04_07205 [Bacteroides sp.]|nr:hypothetical protein [Bacteroides sp.]
MANIQFNLLLQNNVYNNLVNIGQEMNRQAQTWERAQRMVTRADEAMRRYGTNLRGLKQKLEALRAQRDWIPASDTEGVRKANKEITDLEKQIKKLEAAPEGGKLKKWFGQLRDEIPMLKKLSHPTAILGKAIVDLGNYITSSEEVWMKQLEGESKLVTAITGRLKATQDQTKGTFALIAAQQKLGVVSDQVQMAGAGELTTCLKQVDALENMIPVMNDVIAQHHGYNATQENAISVASMMNKALKGETEEMSKCGYGFSEAQQIVLKYGTEAERVAALSEVVATTIGGVNQVLAQTPEGRLKQHANTMADLKERVGALYTQVKAALIPIFDFATETLEKVIGLFEQYREDIVTGIQIIAQVCRVAFTFIRTAIGWVLSVLGGLFTLLKDGHPVVTTLTVALLTFGAVLKATAGYAMLMSIWAGIVKTAKIAWTVAQNILNTSLWACPVTWIVAGVLALIAAIAYVCYKLDGWGTLWRAVIDANKYAFEAFYLFFCTAV